MQLITASLIIEFEKNIKKLFDNDQLAVIPGAFILESKGKEYEIDFEEAKDSTLSSTEILSKLSIPIYVNEQIPDILDFKNIKAEFTDFHIYLNKPEQVKKEKLKIKRIKKLVFSFEDLITKENEDVNNPVLERSANKALFTTIDNISNQKETNYAEH